MMHLLQPLLIHQWWVHCILVFFSFLQFILPLHMHLSPTWSSYINGFSAFVSNTRPLSFCLCFVLLSVKNGSPHQQPYCWPINRVFNQLSLTVGWLNFCAWKDKASWWTSTRHQRARVRWHALLGCWCRFFFYYLSVALHQKTSLFWFKLSDVHLNMCL